MKPDWKDAPGWANWLAMDEDGTWYWTQFEPDRPGFYDSEWGLEGGLFEEAPLKTVGWRNSLERRP